MENQFEVKITGSELVSKALDALTESVKAGGKDLAEEIVRAKKEQITIKKAIDTARWLLSVDWREQINDSDVRRFVIDSSSNPAVTYDGFVDLGTIYIEPRNISREAIETADFETEFDWWIRRAL